MLGNDQRDRKVSMQNCNAAMQAGRQAYRQAGGQVGKYTGR